MDASGSRGHPEQRGHPEHTEAFWASSEQVLRFHLGVATVFALAVAAIPAFGPNRFWLAGLIFGVEVISTVALLRRVDDGAPPSPLMALVDSTLALIVVATVPETFTVAVVVFASMAALHVLWFGPRFSLGLMAVTATLLTLIGRWQEPAMWEISIGAYVICTLASATILNSLARSAEKNRRRFDDLINGVDAVLWEARDDEPIGFVSENVMDALGVPAQEVIDEESFAGRLHPADRENWWTSRERNREGHDTETHLRLRGIGGRYRRVQERVKVTLNNDGTIKNRRGLLVDETTRWQAEAGLRRYSDFIEGIPVALVLLHVVDPDDPDSMIVTDLNPAARHLFGVEQLSGTVKVADAITLDREWRQRLADVSTMGRPVEAPFVKIPNFAGIFALRAVPLPGRSVGVSLEDVTKRARLEESFRHQAMHDSLTGLPNRLQLHERLSEALAGSDGSGDAGDAVALLVVDLDQFKEVNDSLGHEYGDRLLTELARRLDSNLRDCDTVARLGGDEFAVLLTNNANEAAAMDVANRLIELCEQPFNFDRFRFQVSASIGIAISPQHGEDAETLMRRADGAMYRAKSAVDGKSIYSPGQDLQSVRRLELLGDLRAAANRTGDMVVHYQPRIDLRTNRTIGVEALVRWQHPRHGMLPPDEFIELAEVSGTIHWLTRNVSERAAEEMKPLLESRQLELSVNLSTRNLYDSNLVIWVSELMERQGLPAGALCFEITESQLMDDPDQSMTMLRDLRALGIRFSIDDFGTGYSSLSYLRQLPIDEVKIDKSFVQHLSEDDTIVRAVIDLGHGLGLHVVAEGVEDPHTRDLLTEMGCDSAQGFYFSAPLPAADLIDFLSEAWEEPVATR